MNVGDKVIIVKLQGGLGNQMFQYALWRSLHARGTDAKVDLRPFRRCAFHNGYELDRVFNVKPPTASEVECRNMCNDRYTTLARVAKKLGWVDAPKNSKHFCQLKQPACSSFSYLPEVWSLRDTYLDGFWQNTKYFDTVRSYLVSDFAFNEKLDYENASMLAEIDCCESVSIHIRRGDYVGTGWDQCGMDFYARALKEVRRRKENLKLFMFSDDVTWCRNNLQFPGATYVEGNGGVRSHIDMLLMSRCKHNIVANSTFSWWAAWLNSYTNKIVVLPKKWAVGHDDASHGLVCDNWIAM